MRINNNLMAMNTHRQMGAVQGSQAKSMEKLSSGYRINRAGDDAAGLAISEKMRGQIRGLSQASRNAQDGISMIQTAEGALTETHDILQRMRELAVQASNDTLEGKDREAIGEELVQLKDEVDRISSDTQFNGKNLLNGTLIGAEGGSDVIVGDTVNNTTVSGVDVTAAKAQTYSFSAAANSTTLTLTGADGIGQTIDIGAGPTAIGDVTTLNFSELGVKLELTATGVATSSNITIGMNSSDIVVSGSGAATFAIGANEGQTTSVSFADMSASQLGDSSDLATLITNNTAVSTSTLAQTLITELDGAIVDVSTQRAKFGATQNRLEHTIRNLDTSAENLQASESRIRDVDMAKEMMDFTKNNILSQAAQSMLAQANQAPQGVLQLLR